MPSPCSAMGRNERDHCSRPPSLPCHRHLHSRVLMPMPTIAPRPSLWGCRCRCRCRSRHRYRCSCRCCTGRTQTRRRIRGRQRPEKPMVVDALSPVIRVLAIVTNRRNKTGTCRYRTRDDGRCGCGRPGVWHCGRRSRRWCWEPSCLLLWQLGSGPGRRPGWGRRPGRGWPLNATICPVKCMTTRLKWP